MKSSQFGDGYLKLTGSFKLAGQDKFGLAKFNDFLLGEHYINQNYPWCPGCFERGYMRT